MEYRLEGGARRNQGFVGSLESSGIVSFSFLPAGKVPGVRNGDELTDFVEPFLPHFLSKILSQSFCTHYLYLSPSATTY